MTNKHFRYHSIEQFRHVYKKVQDQTLFVKLDDDGNVIRDYNKRLPTLTFSGTEKLHGTNAAIGFNSDGSFWVQSRERIITPESDNAGFAQWVYDNTELREKLLSNIFGSRLDSDPIGAIIIYGEWCGANIQPQVALSKLPKMFIVFDAKLVLYDPSGELIDETWVSKEDIKEITNEVLWSVYDFPTYSITIDFNNPDESINELVRITDSIESRSPIAEALGALGIGEGVVWKCSEHIFKVKGKLHSASHVKTLAAVDIEKMASIKECVESIVSENRLKQGLDVLREQGIEIDNKAIKPFIDWVKNDCIKEEKDTILGSDLDIKDVIGSISYKAKSYFIEEVLRKL